MSELRELDHDIVLDHVRRPRNFQMLAGANRTTEGYNPLCADQITFYLCREGGVETSAFKARVALIGKR